MAGGHGNWPGLWTHAQAGATARTLLVGMERSLDPAGALDPARLRPLPDHRLLRDLFRHALTQQAHHQLNSDPFHDAGALPASPVTHGLPTLRRAAAALHPSRRPNPDPGG